ncbi:MAG: zinc-dependent alcohol dehydrogenase family protein [Actinomycetota bacterium]|nr:zinc-dependent alcohol dehydrogenase family protein [Actinomycetota bacterium]
MKAALYSRFRGPITIEEVPDPAPESDGVVVRVEATGLCRSDWHGWMGHDPDILLPHVPGHELTGAIVATGSDVSRWRVGDRVTVPFVAGCGECEPCRGGDQQVCERQFQPGFTAWGSFAELVALRYADGNLVGVPDEIDAVTAATLGCRFATAFRAIVDQGRVGAGEWVAVHGCGGVGLAAIMIARAYGAGVVAIDPNVEARELARSLGATTLSSDVDVDTVLTALMDTTGGGPHLSIDAIGNAATVAVSIDSLRPRGRHVQIGLLPENKTTIPMGTVIAKELEVLGSHGMQARRYPAMMEMILDGRLEPDRLVTRTIPLSNVTEALPAMGTAQRPGVTVIDRLDD